MKAVFGKPEPPIRQNIHPHQMLEVTRLRKSSLSRAGKIITTAQLPRGAVPAFLAVEGLFDADWRLSVACRNGQIFTIKVWTPLLEHAAATAVYCTQLLRFCTLRSSRGCMHGAQPGKTNKWHQEGRGVLRM